MARGVVVTLVVVVVHVVVVERLPVHRGKRKVKFVSRSSHPEDGGNSEIRNLFRVICCIKVFLIKFESISIVVVKVQLMN